MPIHPSVFRASAPVQTVASELGFLDDLAGTWVGSGFNLIALPDHENNQPFRLMLNATRETLEFKPIGGLVPNRGSSQDDLFMAGLTYLQRVNDAVTNEALHIEPGIWLNVPATSSPQAPATIVRQSTIPHGDSLLAQGSGFKVQGGPQIAAVSPTPTGPGIDPAYLLPYSTTPVPPGFNIRNPNAALTDAIQGQEIISTVVLDVSTNPVGGIVNIPFVTTNANATRMDSIFWIETVQRPNGKPFMQLQYTQTVTLNFLGIDWPHISVATLLKI